jgi:hypothetical protein
MDLAWLRPHQQDPIAQGQGLIHVMGDDQHAGANSGHDATQKPLHIGARYGIKGAERLI